MPRSCTALAARASGMGGHDRDDRARCRARAAPATTTMESPPPPTSSAGKYPTCTCAQSSRGPDAPAAGDRAPARHKHAEFNALFTPNRPVIFAYHGYPWLIHRLTYHRAGHAKFHVRGYKEEGTTTTPFDMVVMNDMDRFHLWMEVITGRRPRRAGRRAAPADGRHQRQAQAWTREHGEDLPEVRTGPGLHRRHDPRPRRQRRV